MLAILFMDLFIFVYNFFEVAIPHGSNGIVKRSNNEYITILKNVYTAETYIIRVDYDNVTYISEQRRFFQFSFNRYKNPLIINNNLIFYSLQFSVHVENNGKFNEVIWSHVLMNIRFLTQAYSNDCLAIVVWTYYDSTYDISYNYHLILIKDPYIAIYKEVDDIDTIVKHDWIELIGLKDCFVYIKIDDDHYSGKITYRFFDFELNQVNSVTEEYEDYLDILFSKLSNTGKHNEFLLCILKKEDMSKDLDTYKCTVYKYQNNELSIIDAIDISIYGYDYSLEFYYFDENKIVFYIYDIYYSENYHTDGIINSI